MSTTLRGLLRAPRESRTKLVSLARSLVSRNAALCTTIHEGLHTNSSIMGAQRVGSHTVQLPTDNIKRRPSHIYIAPKVPAQPHRVSCAAQIV